MAVEKIWKLREVADAENVRQLSSELGVDPVLAELLVQRGVHTFEQARGFFRPSMDDLHDPFLMTDMDKAVERVHQAVTTGEKILVYGDYDVVPVDSEAENQAGEIDNSDVEDPIDEANDDMQLSLF